MQFGNNISSDETHSNQYASGTESEQSFAQRQEIEKSREVIQAYHHSQIAQNFAPHGEYVRAKPRVHKQQKLTRQEMNARGLAPERGSVQPASRQATNTRPQTGFHEPLARGFNPYS